MDLIAAAEWITSRPPPKGFTAVTSAPDVVGSIDSLIGDLKNALMEAGFSNVGRRWISPAPKSGLSLPRAQIRLPRGAAYRPLPQPFAEAFSLSGSTVLALLEVSP